MDISRQNIVFDSLEGIIACVHTILEDPQALVLRVKNRYDPAYSSHDSAGYRDLSINLQVYLEEKEQHYAEQNFAEEILV